MKKITTLLLSVTTSLLLLNCKSEEKKQDFSSLTENYFDDKNAMNPLDATQSGQNQYNDQLQFEMTDSFRKSQEAFFDKYQTALKGFAIEDLSEEEKNSYEIIKWEVEIGKDLLKQPTNLLPVHQFWGTHLTMGQFAGGTGAQPFKTEQDYTNFLKRMDKYAVWIDSAMVYMKKGMAKGVVLPKSLTVKLIPQFAEMATPKIEDNLFYSSIILLPTTFPDRIKNELTAKYTATINNKLIPQYKKMADFLNKEYLPASRATSGIGSLPFGKELYATYVKQWTTTDMTPEQIHELGLKEVARLNAEMEKVKTQVGFKGTLLEFFEVVRNKKELKPFTKPEEVIANFQSIYTRIKPNVDKLFALQPKTKFEIRRTEAFREKTASAEYNQGTADGSRPGIFYVPIPDVANYNMYGDEDLFLHEAVPGHHFQISLQQENENLPDFRKFNWFGAYGEGWALYTESLGKELGLYQDPYQYFGMLGNEMHRAVRLVVDTGLHSKGWTRAQAIQYSLANEAESEASIIPEIERYMAIPGQALSYKIGQLKILELRKKAETKMGAKFDIKKFHEKVLESGVMPLAILENKINAWIPKSN
ncbi:DUF885 domain-containing protein [Flavobacterium sp. GSP27]|uniref:DUF885 domain-containing protein n=1 Tax=unclassified Flavobacterium TaxID=196869 RepID=UPI000F82DF7F|nr:MULTISPECIES: DUF885 domain-containing protein [unclassified Flavobacterium]RTY84164.1 DUF885 domain-containing protein [Flavobacterium sp. LS1P28]RTY87285.1 DUF885 domain-containing protein [Flavobacterium sp. GSN2]RTZ11420.1 DUF885 domain-containing protein [Flavobacterium sp. GSP27]